MTEFLAVAFVLAVIAGLCIVVPLSKRRASKNDALDLHQANLHILRDQWAEIEEDHRAGIIGDAERAAAKAELERRTLEETAHSKKTAPHNADEPSLKGGIALWGVVGTLAVFLVAVAFYAVIGTPRTFLPGVAVKAETQQSPHENAHDLSPGQMEEMLRGFAAKLENEPDNIEGWMMLARSWVQIGKFMQAAETYEKILDRVPEEPNVLADYADLMATMQDGRLDGRPMELIERALKADPTHWKALALAGTHAFAKEDYAQAEAYWTKLKATLPPESNIAQSIDESIAEARAKAGKTP